jgi:lipid A 3-O-deacylase
MVRQAHRLITPAKFMIQKWLLIPGLLLLFSGHARGGQLVDEITFGLGHSRNGINILRTGLRHDFDRAWFGSDYGWLSAYAEASINYWFNDGEKVVAGAVSPVFTYTFHKISATLYPYVEGGIGAALISNTTINDKDLSTNFQFEDRVGIGIKSKKLNFTIRFMHYSNADLKKPNSGIDILLLNGAYLF